jgi:hypothetical protein
MNCLDAIMADSVMFISQTNAKIILISIFLTLIAQLKIYNVFSMSKNASSSAESKLRLGSINGPIEEALERGKKGFIDHYVNSQAELVKEMNHKTREQNHPPSSIQRNVSNSSTSKHDIFPSREQKKVNCN